MNKLMNGGPGKNKGKAQRAKADKKANPPRKTTLKKKLK